MVDRIDVDAKTFSKTVSITE